MVRCVLDVDQVRDRWLMLQDTAAIAKLREHCEQAAVDEQAVPPSWWAHHPHPFAREMEANNPWRVDAQPWRLGVDVAGRPVFEYLREDLFQLYDWAEDRCDVIKFDNRVRRLQRFRFLDGRLMEVVATEGHKRLDGRPLVEVQRWSYEHGRPWLMVETQESGAHPYFGGPERGPYWRAKAYRFSYDATGELKTITRFMGARDFADGGDADDAQSAARAGFPADFEESQPLYDARTSRWEIDVPDPDHAYNGLAAPLSDALYAAVEQQRGALGPLEFVLIRGGEFPYQAVAADASFVERALAMNADVRELLRAAHDVPHGTVLADAIDTAPPDVLRRIRAGRQALADAYRPGVHETLMRELVTGLNARSWSRVAPTFLVVTTPSRDDTDDSDDGSTWYTQEEVDEMVEAYMATLDASLPLEQKWQRVHEHLEAVLDAPRRRRVEFPDVEAAVGRERVDALVERLSRDTGMAPPQDDPVLPQSREELAALLTDAGLGSDEAGRVAADALWGIPLEPGGIGRSRLGGSPILSAHAEWPHAEGRPLAHLATIALDELPDVEGREHLPADGTLSFFADLSEEGDFVDPVEPSRQSGHDLVAIIHTPAGTSTREPDPPGHALLEQRVTPVARLQLRHLGFGYGKRLLGLDALAEQAVEQLTERINGAVDHQLLGYPRTVQDDPRQPGQIVLFHIADDPALDFSIMDAGDIHFLGTPQDIEALRWDQLTVWPSSC
jgi:hypothetical protein